MYYVHYFKMTAVFKVILRDVIAFINDVANTLLRPSCHFLLIHINSYLLGN